MKSFTDNPVDVGAYGPLVDSDGQHYTITSARLAKSVVVVRFAEVNDRTHAERINGRDLFVDRSVLPDPGDEDEFYPGDLIGFSVETITGEPVGTVVAFHDFGAGDIVEIKPSRGQTVMAPFSQDAVPTIDAKAGKLIVDPGPAGLEAAAPERGEDGGR